MLISDSEWWVRRGGDGWWQLKGLGFLFEVLKCPKIDYGYGCTLSVYKLKITELHALNEWAMCELCLNNAVFKTGRREAKK